MAAGQERLLKRRIRSIESTKKITRAMELIASSRIARARSRIVSARPYVEGMTVAARAVALDDHSSSNRLLHASQHGKFLTVVIAADRGLCGFYNSAVLRASETAIADRRAEGRDGVVVAIGKKAHSYFRYRGIHVDVAFSGMSDRPRFEDAKKVASSVVQPFLDKEIDIVEIVSTRFISAGRHRVETRRILPIPNDEPSEGGGMGYTEFEPTTEEVLNSLVPAYVEASVFGALLEASASEHASRQRAMAAATENAEELIKSLTRTMNRVRQDAITTEIMEIVGGSEALRQAAERASGDEGRTTEVSEGSFPV